MFLVYCIYILILLICAGKSITDIEVLLSMIFMVAYSIISLNTINRVLSFLIQINRLKVVKYRYLKNIFLLISSIFFLIMLPIALLFVNNGVVKFNNYSILLILFVAIIFGLNTFMGVTTEVYKKNILSKYTVRNGILGNEILSFNAGSYDKGFIIDTYCFNYSDVQEIIKESSYIKISGLDTLNSGRDSSKYLLIIEADKTRKYIDELLEINLSNF